jgi:hypothetical protein
MIEDELYLLAKFSEDDNVKIFEKLSKNIIVYDSYIKDLIETEVPNDIYSPYLQYINSIHEYSFILKKIISLGNDPIALINYVQVLQNSLEKMDFVSKIFSSIFNNNNI